MTTMMSNKMLNHHLQLIYKQKELLKTFKDLLMDKWNKTRLKYAL